MDSQKSLKIKLKLPNASNSPSRASNHEMEGFPSDEEMYDEVKNNTCENSEGVEVFEDRSKGVEDESSRDRHKRSKKKKKKKEKERLKHKHRHLRPDCIEEPPAKRFHSDFQIEDMSSFKELLKQLLENLKKKDEEDFFGLPVTDIIAPGYSAIIKEPMDFSRMKHKLETDQYSSLTAFKNDFELICNNCMKYNQDGTIYHKASKKLLHSGQKLLQPQRIAMLIRSMPGLLPISSAMLGFDVDGINLLDYNDGGSDTRRSSDMDGHSDSASSQDDSESIIEQAEKAAKEAADRLTLKKPSSTLGFLRQKKDGTTSLNFLTGCEGQKKDGKQKVISLGLLTGKPSPGTASLTNFKEDKRSMAKPVRPLCYGAFSSFCPSYDSTFANLNREESEMIFSTYGNETAVQYAQSICDFSQDCDMAMHLVDQLLNLLTHDQHSRTKAIIEERRRSLPKPEANNEEPQNDNSISFSNLRTLNEYGLDMSFLGKFEQLEQHEKQMDSKLAASSALIECLAKEQHNRLSKPLPSNLNNIPTASSRELQLAEKVSDALLCAAKEVPPSAIAPVPMVRRALGITVTPVNNEVTSPL